MPLYKNAYPILEYDDEVKAIIEPNRSGIGGFPENCLMSFLGEALEQYVETAGAEKIGAYESEMGEFPVWKTRFEDLSICVAQALVGSASAAMMTEYLISRGVKKLIVCGGCGVLTTIPVGNAIIPTSALRDEGASYHYLPPAREITLDAPPIEAMRQTLKKHQVPWVEAKTWTTDAFFRETADLVNYRREEGCTVVEMECAAIAAVARFRGILFGQLLYSGDILADSENYDEREWYNKAPVRERLFRLALESLYALSAG
jgi:uridine phosphorylase